MRICKLKLNNEEYKLTLTRESVKWLEAQNFSLENFIAKPITYYDLLWASLFLAYHQEVVSKNSIDLLKVCEKEYGQPYVTSIIKFAIEEYKSFMNALTDTNSIKKQVDLKIEEM